MLVSINTNKTTVEVYGAIGGEYLNNSITSHRETEHTECCCHEASNKNYESKNEKHGDKSECVYGKVKINLESTKL